MKWGLFTVILIHGLIHFMGFAKAFEFAELPQLTQPVSESLGIVWLAAGFAMLLAGALLIISPRAWWVMGLVAVLLSQITIISSWDDAKFGALVNLVVLTGVILGFAAQGPLSFQAEYMREVKKRLEQPFSPRLVTEEDLAILPEPVQRYLRSAGAIGQPFIHHFVATWRGRIRATKDDPWMAFTAEQHNFVGEPSRFFLMKARRGGLPVDVYHAFQDNSGTMSVRLLSLIPLVNSAGPELDRAEAVTLFNDWCLLAPTALIDPAIQWELIDEHSVRGYYTVGPNTISAVLVFNETGNLVDFISDDRLVASPDGDRLTEQRWSTPVKEYRNYGQRRAFTRGEGKWHPQEGAFAYIELELLDLQTNTGM